MRSANAMRLSILMCMFLFPTIAGAAPQTDLSRRVLLLPDQASKASVIAALGPPTHAYVGKDLKRKFIDDPNVSYVLLWENPPCSAIEVWFGRDDRMNGMDGGQFCGKKLELLSEEAAKPNKKYACSTSARQSICR